MNEEIKGIIRSINERLQEIMLALKRIEDRQVTAADTKNEEDT